MSDLLIETAKKKVLSVFNFLNAEGYSLIISESKDYNSFKLVFHNETVNKKVNLEITHSEKTKRFFVTIYINNEPYKTVDDYISFDEYLKKNKILGPTTLENEKLTIEFVEKYIEEYAGLFKKYGIELISTSKQFPGYYPKWN